ncbi:thiamine pyrophosphate-dependent dehydrogenase E1 component subunit alpha [Cupriavidus sp. AcVe19-1a]|uniref:thiamine pyrophosphate-dependent dehydrogenase E1 component subunit alpha n=1 Tax=Cupriavidus sp. AcVe19-1a TaxID=2821359 RepID=UPI001AE38679|nr:thiamine pyrophosphate-dependent dehydrogenase E1 component subunit alpha [Cupriavidus sp. AcVe19-1a]MBP0630492.1 thiamine pyrophosphate-dependent dehydrogenase E1 component subunit alpha [Cupriavidus sp. AcVe19-1a]
MAAVKQSKEPANVGRLQALYRTMSLIRQVETALTRLFANGEVPGFIHLSIGQEAVAAGVASALEPADSLATTHRGHGHVLARGMDVAGFMKEIMGREGGLCKGRGGSMHVADLSLGILGANGIVGAGIPIALGSAMAHKARQTGGVAVAFFGDGAMAEGVLHETLNMAALWKSPLLLVCENNGWSEFSPTSRQFAASLEKLAAAFSVSYAKVDGNDAMAVSEAAHAATAQLRDGNGPFVLECITTRVRGHFEGDAQKYRDTGELESVHELDPLTAARRQLQERDVDTTAIDNEIGAQVEAAIEAARADRLPTPEAAILDVYTQPRQEAHA